MKSMSCDVAVAAYLFLASTGSAPAPAPIPVAVESVAREPLFAEIVGRAGRLKAQVERYRKPELKASPAPAKLQGFPAFEAEVAHLAELDMKGHEELARRGTDGDLKCILRGISQDLGVQLRELSQALSGAAQDAALKDMAYLLNDNVEVITAPPAPPV
jgi:hypothetical protein